MEEMNKAYATFEERDRIASLGGIILHIPTYFHIFRYNSV